MVGCSNSKENTKTISNSNKASESYSKVDSPGNANSANGEKQTNNNVDKKTENKPVQADDNKNTDIKEERGKLLSLHRKKAGLLVRMLHEDSERGCKW